MKIETKRLVLRPPRKSDWKDIVEGIGNINVCKNLEVVPYPYKKKDALWWLNKSLGKKNKDYQFMIILKKENKVIGCTSITSINKSSNVARTGSWINEKYWKKGYITEAKIPVLDFAFNKLKIRKLETSAYTDNIGSNKMSQKLGYKKEGTKRKSKKSLAGKKIHDENIYGLFKNDWKKTRPKLIKELNKKLKNEKNN